MVKLSAIIIAKNAENIIADCLDSVSFADEIIVVDNNSTDRTYDIARMKGVNIIQSRNKSFAEIRNQGFRKAKYEWILYLDADERISNNLKEGIIKILSAKNIKISAFKLKRKNYYFGKHEWPTVESLERLFRKKHLTKWYGELHETPVVEGEIGEITDGYLLHYTHKDLESMLRKTIEWSGIEANLRLNVNHPKVTWWRFPRVMITAFYDSFIRQKGYKAGTVGVIESLYQAFSIFITYARLWEMQQDKFKNNYEK